MNVPFCAFFPIDVLRLFDNMPSLSHFHTAHGWTKKKIVFFFWQRNFWKPFFFRCCCSLSGAHWWDFPEEIFCRRTIVCKWMDNKWSLDYVHRDRTLCIEKKFSSLFTFRSRELFFFSAFDFRSNVRTLCLNNVINWQCLRSICLFVWCECRTQKIKTNRDECDGLSLRNWSSQRSHSFKFSAFLVLFSHPN